MENLSDVWQRIREITYLEINGLVEFSIPFLGATLEYVIFGYFISDPSEKRIRKLRQGLGETYFIKVEQSLENVQYIKQGCY